MSGETRRVRLEWSEGFRFSGHTREGAVTAIDGEGEAGPSPMLLLLEAIGSCAGSDVVDILEKGREPLEGLEVQVSGTRREEPPRRYVSLRLRFRMWGDVDRGKAERAVELSLETYCSAFQSLREELREATEAEVVLEEELPAG